MNVIAKFVLGAKAWEVFLLLMAVSFLPLVVILQDGTQLFIILKIVSTYIGFIWLWSLGAPLNSLVREDLRKSLRPLSAVLIFSAVYFFVLFQSANNTRLLDILGPIGIVVFFCMIYMLDFAGTVLLLAENHKYPNFSKFAGPFFSLCFWPIGIWFVQPRINRLYPRARPRTAKVQSPHLSPR